MSARLAPSGAGRFDHAVDDRQYPTPAEERAIEVRTAELIAERLADAAQFADLMSGIEPTSIYPHLQRALLELDRACRGDSIARDAVLSAVSRIQRIVKAEAQSSWSDEAEALAEQEILECP